VVRIEAGENRIGTGFVVDPRGLIATNLHVIAGQDAIKVRLFKDPTEYPAVAIAAVDRQRDLALFWIQPKHILRAVKLGDSNAVSAGDPVVAIGNPLGLDYTVSAGLISQVRPLDDNITILQISAPISQGSSGGPLFNQFGEVIGVTTGIVTDGQSINLAVPDNYLRPMIAHKTTIALREFANQTKDADPEGDGAASLREP
jgi:serine protease Do